MDKELEKLLHGLKAATDDVKATAEKSATELKNLGTMTAETKAKADETMIKFGEISEKVKQIEQKLLAADNGPTTKKTLGEAVLDDPSIKEFLAKGHNVKGSAAFHTKAIISALATDADGSVGDALVPFRVPGILAGTERRLTVRDLITPGRISTNALQYVKETGFTNGAATVTETAGTAKQESQLKLDIVNSSVTTIAHWVTATRQILSDLPQLQSYIDGRLMYGLKLVEENQLLNGGGTGTDLNGIYTQATAYVAPIVPTAAGDLTKIDIIRLAMLQAFLAEFPPTGIVMHPSDWADIELTKTTEGAYLFANPQNGSEARLWRLPVVETQAMTIDKFLVGAFKLGAQVFDREDANIMISTEHADYFTRNLVAILAEERLALAVYRPEAFVKGDFSDSLAA